jgi:hypothetical protein
VTTSPQVAICLFGQMRTYDQCYPLLKENILDDLDPDVFIHTWQNRGGTWKKKDDIDKQRIDENSLHDYFSPTETRIEEFNPDYYHELGKNKVPKSITEVEEFHKGLLPMFYKIHSVVSLKCDYENENEFNYDIVILMRPDLAVLEGLSDEVIENPNVLFVHGRSPYQIDDKFMISSTKNINYVASIWDMLNTYWDDKIEEDYGKMGIPDSYTAADQVHMGVPERLLHYHIKQSPIDALPHRIRALGPVRVGDSMPVTSSHLPIREAPILVKRAKTIFEEEGFIELIIRGLRQFQ